MKRRKFWPALLALVAAPKALLGLKNRDKHSGAPHCCHMFCGNDAEFSIHGSSGHFEDVTEACEDHVGALLGTPMWLEKESEHWVVYPIVYSL
jgi:hypothetical protein